MKTSELLQELQENLLRDVSQEAVDNSAASLWSPASLVRYLDDAQNRMARQTECLRDGDTLSVTRVPVAQNIDTYDLDPRILRVYTAMTEDGRFLKETSLYHEFDGSSSVRGDLPRRQPIQQHITRYSLGVGEDKIRLYPTPTKDENGVLVRLYVARLPLEPLEYTEPEREPEVPRDYHLDLVEWAAYRALRNHDVDSENIQKANIHRAAFERAVAELRLQMRRKHAAPAAFGGRVHN